MGSLASFELQANTTKAVSYSSHITVEMNGWTAYPRVAPRLIEDLEYNAVWNEAVFDQVVAAGAVFDFLFTMALPSTPSSAPTL